MTDEQFRIIRGLLVTMVILLAFARSMGVEIEPSERGSWTADVGMRGNRDMQEIIDTG